MPHHTSDTSSLEVNLEVGWVESDPSAAPQIVSSPNPQREKIRDLQDAAKIHYPRDNEKIRVSVVAEKIAVSTVQVVPDLDRELPPLPDETAGLLGLGKKTTWIVGAIAIVSIVAIMSGTVAGVLGRSHHRSEESSAANVTSVTIRKTSPILENSKMASLYYVDESNITHYRVYFQEQSGLLQESAWDSNSTKWTVTNISGPSVDVQLGTPLACACGYPHAMKNYTFVCHHVQVKSVYHTGASGMLYERQAPVNETGLAAWADNNFSGLYTAANNSYLAAYWEQDFENVNQTLNVMWQQPQAYAGLTIGQYTSDVNGSYPWVFTNLNSSVRDGSTFALSRYDGKNYLRVYTTSGTGTIQQSVYSGASYTIAGLQDTGLSIADKAPITALTLDNTGMYSSWGDRPQCSWLYPTTQLFLYASEDRSTVSAVTWNCSAGLVDISSLLSSILRPNRHYGALSSHGDGKVYAMFDQGDGPQIEEWTVPKYSGQLWTRARNVTVRKAS